MTSTFTLRSSSDFNCEALPTTTEATGALVGLLAALPAAVGDEKSFTATR
jgi:hypothetical protein